MSGPVLIGRGLNHKRGLKVIRCCNKSNQLFSFERTTFSTLNKYGNYSEKDPPVPIPNTVVKLLSAEDSEGFPFVKAGRCRSFLI